MKVMFNGKKYKVEGNLRFDGERIFITTPFDRKLVDEFKQMEGAHYCGYDTPPLKAWRISNTLRNQFQLNFLQGINVYARYDAVITDEYVKTVMGKANYPLYSHQGIMTAHMLLRRQSISACEMGLGKTLSAIAALEILKIPSHLIWYIGPRAGVRAVKREISKWKANIYPNFYTYEEMTRYLKRDELKDSLVPQAIIFDESSKVKTPTAQRSQASLLVANRCREKYKDDAYIIEMTGTPAPKTPIDWWHQCEVACPGFLREGSIQKFKNNLSIVEQRQSIQGGMYPHLITWLDDESKCAVCGMPPDGERHTSPELMIAAGLDAEQYHEYRRSVNEVNRLYKRLNGLVLVQFKKDCLELPEKTYETIVIKPTVETIRTMQLITKTSPRAITALTLCRELSDGFQYKEVDTGDEIICKVCHGAGTCKMADEVEDTFAPNTGDLPADASIGICDKCGGSGKIPRKERIPEFFGTPKDDVLIELLDEHEEVGRIIVWGGFTGTIDRLVRIAHDNDWATIRVDGRGYRAEQPDGTCISSEICLSAMDASQPTRALLLDKIPKLAFVGHPKAGGMALTLTASPTEVFYSNSFDGEARMQAEDRFHRAGMDTNRGARIIDLVHLQTDQLVIDNLLKKKRLQDITMGEIEKYTKVG